MPGFSSTDSAHMSRALQLALRGQYLAHPNPMVGCVVAKGPDVIAEGWHERAGGAHAEVNALQAAGETARGATLYVTLEPCVHQGKTPPCTDAILEAGVSRVVVAMRDPFPAVAGRGLERLSNSGIETRVGLMQSAAESLNESFVCRVTRGRPFVRVKVAASIDGAIAMQGGESQWITGPAARRDVQRLRARCGAIMTGIGTVLSDDPSLNVRENAVDSCVVQPMRVVLDSRLRMPVSAAMLALPGMTLVCCRGDHDSSRLRDAGAEVCTYRSDRDVVDVTAVLEDLARREVNEVLVEAGPALAGHLLEKDLVNELVIYQAPHIMGSETRKMFHTSSWSALADRRNLDIRDVRRIGEDTRITARIRR